MSIVALTPLALEIIEHQPNLYALDLDFVREATAMNRQTVLVIEDAPFSELVNSLLSQVNDLNTVGFAPRDEAEMVEEIERAQPAVVVLDAATRLTDPNGLLGLLKPELDLRVVLVSLGDNTVRIYDKHQVLITQGEDLVAIIRRWIQA